MVLVCALCATLQLLQLPTVLQCYSLLLLLLCATLLA
jgi:hypothetical protein